MKKSESAHTSVMLGRPGSPLIALVSLIVSLIWTCAKGPATYAEDSPAAGEKQVAEQAKALWDSGAMVSALEKDLDGLPAKAR